MRTISDHRHPRLRPRRFEASAKTHHIARNPMIQPANATHMATHPCPSGPPGHSPVFYRLYMLGGGRWPQKSVVETRGFLYNKNGVEIM